MSPAPDPAEGRYRSLRDLSARPLPIGEPRPDQPARATVGTARTTPPATGPTNQGPADTDGREPRPRRRRRRVLLVTLIVLALLITAGYFTYQVAAPYFGGGYHTGRSATLGEVKFTVSRIQCGLSSTPYSKSRPAGQYCVVVVSAHNRGADGSFIDLRDWSVDLDVGIRDVQVDADAMRDPVAVVLRDDKNIYLAFDIPDGARLSALNITLNGSTRSIDVS